MGRFLPVRLGIFLKMQKNRKQDADERQTQLRVPPFSLNRSLIAAPTPFSKEEITNRTSEYSVCRTLESAFFSSESEANITHLLRVLFSKLREGIQNESPGIHDHELIALHKMIYNNPQLQWNINMMAAKLHLDVYKRQPPFC